MKLLRLLPAILLVAVGLLPLSSSAAPEPVYVALGDSIAAGLVTTLPRERGYPAIVASLMPGTQLDNLAVPGETDESFQQTQLQHFQQKVADIRAAGATLRAVTVTLGGNDILALRDETTAQRQDGLNRFKTSYPAALTAIKAALGDLQPTIVVTTYYDLSDGDPNQTGSDAWWLHQFNDVIRAAAPAQGARVADLEPAFRGHIADWTWYPTDIHPNNAGHAEIATLVWQALGFDTTPPAVTVQSPQPGALSRRTPTVRVTATDDVGVTAVELWQGDSRLADLMWVPSQNAYLGVWDGRQVTGSQVALTIKARDRAGNQASADVTVTLPGSGT